MQTAVYLVVLGLLFSTPVAALSLEQLKHQLVQRNQDTDPDNDIRSIDALIGGLPAAYKQHFTLMYQSRSLQSASKQAPRVILFGENAQLLLSFTGSDAERGADAVEAIEYRPDNAGGRFVFQQIRFTEQQVLFSEENPPVCLSCHTQGTLQEAELRPNWEPYSQWPGAMGSNADILQRGSEEFRLYQDYQARFATMPRYRHLAINSLYPQIHPSAQLQAIYFGKHNKRLSDAIALLNLQRVATRLTQTPHYAQYKYTIFAAIGCQDYSNHADAIQHFAKVFFPPLVATRHLQAFNDHMLFDGSDQWHPLPPSNPNFPLLNLILAPRGIETGSWSTNFTPAERLVDPRFQLPKNARRQFLAHLQQADPSLDGLLDYRHWLEASSSGLNVPQGTLFSRKRCEQLAQASQRSFNYYLVDNPVESLFPPGSPGASASSGL